MKLLKYFPILLFFSLLSCNKDDGKKTKPPRDENEVALENQQEIVQFLKTHFYHLESNPVNNNYQRIVFDTIAGDDADKQSIMDADELKSKTVKPDKVAYTLYYLQIRKGDEAQYQPTFGDKIAMTYNAQILDGTSFEESVNPEVIDIPHSKAIAITKGTIAAITEFKGASSFEENSDGTISFSDDFGIGAVFVPSGLGYFQSPPLSSALQPYAPFILKFQLYKAVQMDHDNDGIPSYLEDVNGNGFLLDDDTDNDGVPNFMDPDDDGDGKLTRDEIEVNDANGDGIITPDELTFPDYNNDGTPDYLDPNA